MKTNMNYYLDKEILRNNINKILENLSGKYNIYLHHIWGMNDREENIKNSIMRYGIEVKYRKSMMSTCCLIENPTADKIMNYYFANQNSNRFVVAVALPKNVTLNNGISIPFSNGQDPLTPLVGDKLNETYVSVYDVCKGFEVAKEFVLFSFKTDVKDCHYELEINENHISNSPHEKEILNPYIERAEKMFEIGEMDTGLTILNKIDYKLDSFNAANQMFHETYVSDFDFD